MSWLEVISVIKLDFSSFRALVNSCALFWFISHKISCPKVSRMIFGFDRLSWSSSFNRARLLWIVFKIVYYPAEAKNSLKHFVSWIRSLSLFSPITDFSFWPHYVEEISYFEASLPSLRLTAWALLFLRWSEAVLKVAGWNPLSSSDDFYSKANLRCLWYVNTVRDSVCVLVWSSSSSKTLCSSIISLFCYIFIFMLFLSINLFF